LLLTGFVRFGFEVPSCGVPFDKASAETGREKEALAGLVMLIVESEFA
jgi:hypothetical protein